MMLMPFVSPYFPVADTDPYFANVSLLIQGNGVDASTSILDTSSTGHSVTVVGNAQVDTGIAQFPIGSIIFDGAGDRCTVANHASLQFGTGDFTIDFWVYLSGSRNEYLHDQRPTGVNGAYPAIFINSSRVPQYVANSAAVIVGSALSLSTWHYGGVKRFGTTTQLWINGSQVGSNYSDSTNYGSGNLFFGDASFNPVFPFLGNAVIRITKGIARDLSVVPTAEFPDA